MVSENLIKKYKRSVPRYTSFPTANHFHEGLDEGTVKSWIKAVPEENAISLYIHIPFCLSMCGYCGCFTRVSGHYQPIKKYITALVREIQHTASILGKQRKVSAIHFGGGTPTILETYDMARIFEVIDAGFQRTPDCEVAIEVDPRSLRQEMIFTLAHWGLHRVSLGIQDTNPAVQEAIGRAQPCDVVESALEMLESQHITNINMDLIYGLPCQTVETMTETAGNVVKWRPSRVSLFGYAHVPWMRPHQKELEKYGLPSPTERARLFETAEKILCDNGYIPVGIDHFVLPDDPMADALKNKTLRRNFQGYTTDRAETILAFGVSGISRFPQGYVQNTTSLRTYQEAVSSNHLTMFRGYLMKEYDSFYATLIDQFMCYGEVNMSETCWRFGKDEKVLAPAMDMLRELEKDGLCRVEKGVLTLLPNGRLFERLIASCFDPYFENGVAQKHAQAV